jgi:metallo-beta-lactamase class B
MLPAALISLLLSALATPACVDCEKWNRTQAPFRIHGNTWYVGVRGLSSVLITSAQGHVLIDGDLPESADEIAASISALGFRIEDVKLILNTHVHFDHAGGIAALQRKSGARVAASAASAAVLRRGESGPDDPQFGTLLSFPPVSRVDEFQDGASLRVGPISLTAHLTPGHAPGGTTWTWVSCEGSRCLQIVFADSLTPVSAPAFKFTQHPAALQGFEKSFAVLAGLPCDILISAHPDASGFWSRVAKRKSGDRDAMIDARGCAAYAERYREVLRKRLADESR